MPHQTGVWNSLVFNTELWVVMQPQTPRWGKPGSWESFVVSRELQPEKQSPKVLLASSMCTINPSHHASAQTRCWFTLNAVV